LFLYPFSTAYSASKGHLLFRSIGLRSELAYIGVLVQAVLPSNTYSEI
jgi:short-subunit dehydrogenase